MPEQDDAQMVEELLGEVNRLQGKNDQLSRDVSAGQYVGSKDSNFLSVQLEAAELLIKLERFYRGDHLGPDPRNPNNVIWLKQKNKDLIPLNPYGVSLLMEIVTKYIDKNTILSYYQEQRIYEILGDVGDEITLVIYCNYERMGMDTYSKKTKFRLIVTTTLHLIESAYRRAIEGKAMEELNRSKVVTQSDVIGRDRQMATPLRKNKFSLLNPKTWGAQ